MARMKVPLCAAPVFWASVLGASVLGASVLGASPAPAFTRPKTQPDAEVRACPEVGAGYVRIPGSSTCVKVGGLVRIEGAAIGRSR